MMDTILESIFWLSILVLFVRVVYFCAKMLCHNFRSWGYTLDPKKPKETNETDMNEQTNQTNSESEQWAQSQLARVKEEMERQPRTTQELLLESLGKMRCQYVVNEERQTVEFGFEGGSFVAHTNSYNRFLDIHFLGFYEVEMYDTARVEKLRRAVNEANLWQVGQTFFTVSDGSMYAHCKLVFPFTEQMPERDDILVAYLRLPFTIRRFIDNKMEEYDNEPQ